MISQSYTAVVERNIVWKGQFESEPYEGAWAHEAIFFVRALEASGMPEKVQARVQISADGINWCDEGTSFDLPGGVGVAFGKVTHFGGWLRIVGELPRGAELKVIVALSLKE